MLLRGVIALGEAVGGIFDSTLKGALTSSGGEKSRAIASRLINWGATAPTRAATHKVMRMVMRKDVAKLRQPLGKAPRILGNELWTEEREA